MMRLIMMVLMVMMMMMVMLMMMMLPSMTMKERCLHSILTVCIKLRYPRLVAVYKSALCMHMCVRVQWGLILFPFFFCIHIVVSIMRLDSSVVTTESEQNGQEKVKKDIVHQVHVSLAGKVRYCNLSISFHSLGQIVLWTRD